VGKLERQIGNLTKEKTQGNIRSFAEEVSGGDEEKALRNSSEHDILILMDCH
jgi:hypothetical protein